MDATAWAPVGVVLLIVTGLASLATADLQTVTVTLLAFAAGFAVGRAFPFRHPRQHHDDGGTGA